MQFSVFFNERKNRIKIIVESKQIFCKVQKFVIIVNEHVKNQWTNTAWPRWQQQWWRDQINITEINTKRTTCKTSSNLVGLLSVIAVWRSFSRFGFRLNFNVSTARLNDVVCCFGYVPYESITGSFSGHVLRFNRNQQQLIYMEQKIQQKENTINIIYTVNRKRKYTQWIEKSLL